MSTVAVYSRCMNDITFAVYEQVVYEPTSKEANKLPFRYTDRVVSKVVINGLNTALRSSRVLSNYTYTMVDKDIWDIIVKNNPNDQMLKSGQIFTTKNENEANAIIKDSSRSIFDFETKASHDSKIDALEKKQQTRRMM